MQEKSGRGIEVLLLILASVALIVMVIGGIGMISPEDSVMGGGMGHGVGGGDSSSTITLGTAIFLGGGLMFIVVLFAVLMMRTRKAPTAPQPATMPQVTPAQASEAAHLPSEEAQRLAIKLLSGDERKMFRRIVDGGGEVLQRDLVAEGTFSKAKVTRLLDKLERKDLIVRSRYGSTNKVRVSESLGK